MKTKSFDQPSVAIITAKACAFGNCKFYKWLGCLEGAQCGGNKVL